jgi:GT2 family glycosyltransferase
MDTIAVIIPTLGRMFWVNQLVASLLHGTRKPDEIIVVDQTPESDRSPIAYDEIQRLTGHGSVKYKFTPRAGSARARNVGAAATAADLLVYLDDDVFVPDYFLDEYERIFALPAISAATGMILVHARDDGTFKPLVAQESLPTKPTMLRGANFAIRREAYVRMGGMDERFVRGCHHEDWDLAWRVYEAGLQAVWSPDPWCYHAVTGDGGSRWRSFSGIDDRAYNIAYFHVRHPGALGARRKLHSHLLRQFVLNRGNLYRPWSLPVAGRKLLRAYRRAVAAAEAGPLLPFGDGVTGVAAGSRD